MSELMCVWEILVAWATYGLGSEAKNLPGFAVLSSGVGTSGGASNFSSGFMPSTYQGVPFRSGGEPILYLNNPNGVSPDTQRAGLDALRDLNEKPLSDSGDTEIASRIASYEPAFRMQTAGPELVDFSKESPSTLERSPGSTPPTACSPAGWRSAAFDSSC